MIKRDSDCRREHRFDIPEPGFPVFGFPGFLEIEQKLKLGEGQTASPLGVKSLPEQRIGRWNYTIVPWED